MSGLQPSTVSEIVEQLLAEGWIREGTVVRGSRGRPSTMLTLRDELLVFALDIRPDRAIIGVLDLPGAFYDGKSARLRGATAVLLHAHSGYLITR